MTFDSYMRVLAGRMSHQFDLLEDHREVSETGVDLLARYSAKGEKHIFSKNVKLYVLEQYEFCYIKAFREQVTIQLAEQFARVVASRISHVVEPHPDHKNTFLTGVIIAENGASREVKEFAQKYKHQKIFRFFLHGWCDVRLVLVDFLGKEVVHSKHRNSRHLGKLYNIPGTV